MEAVAKNLREQYKVQTMIIQFDFAQLATPEDVKKLYDKFDAISEDVCIVANVAGKAHVNPIHKHTVDICFNIINVNVNAQVFVSRYWLAKLEERY